VKKGHVPTTFTLETRRSTGKQLGEEGAGGSTIEGKKERGRGEVTTRKENTLVVTGRNLRGGGGGDRERDRTKRGDCRSSIDPVILRKRKREKLSGKYDQKKSKEEKKKRRYGEATHGSHRPSAKKKKNTACRRGKEAKKRVTEKKKKSISKKRIRKKGWPIRKNLSCGNGNSVFPPRGHGKGIEGEKVRKGRRREKRVIFSKRPRGMTPIGAELRDKYAGEGVEEEVRSPKKILTKRKKREQGLTYPL